MLIQSSAKFGPTTSSATSARPICDPKFRTPGTARSSLLTWTVNALHRFERSSRLADPVHQEVGLLEIGQEFFSKEGNGDGCEVELDGYDPGGADLLVTSSGSTRL